MAYKILSDNKVIHITAPNNLTPYQSRKVENTKTPILMLNLVKQMRENKLKVNGRNIRITH